MNSNFKQWLIDTEEAKRVIEYNGLSAIERAIVKDGFVPFSNETYDFYDGVQYAKRGAEKLNVQPKQTRTYYCVVGQWDDVRYADAQDDEQASVTYRPIRDAYITQAFGVNPQNYPVWGTCGHGGIDLRAPLGVECYATDTGTVVHAGNKKWSSGNVSGYGYHVVIEHSNYRSLYAHLAAPLKWQVGDTILAGQTVGISGNTGHSTGPHLHFSIFSDEQDCHHATKFGYFIDPTFALDAPAPTAKIDLLYYLAPLLEASPLYRVRSNTGHEEIFQTQWVDGQVFRLIKNSQFEELAVKDNFIYRGLDTSPGPAPDYAERPGALRYYVQFNDGDNMAKWCHRYMAVGDTYYDDGHNVQFYYKDNCQPSEANSGKTSNMIRLIAHYESLDIGKLNIANVIELTNGNETWLYAYGVGLVAWRSDWAQSEIKEWVFGEDLQAEDGCWQ